MELILQILSIALVLIAFIGVIAIIGIVAGIIMIINGGEVRIGYVGDDEFENNEQDD